MELTPAEKIRANAKEATRQALIRSALSQMVEAGGLETPSVEAICKRAGYTRGTFYLYFKDRNELLDEALVTVLTDMIDVLFFGAAEEAEHSGEIVRHFNHILASDEFPDLQENVRAGYMAVMRGLRPGCVVRDRHAEIMESVIDRLARVIADDQREGRLREELDPRNLAVVIALTAVGSVMWNNVGIEFDSAEIGETLVELFATSATSLSASGGESG